MLFPRTAEVATVTSSTATGVVIGNRGLGASTAAALLDNDDIFVIGSAIGEGADVGIPDEWGETQHSNKTQIFRSPFGATRTRENSASFFGQTRGRLRAETMIAHAIDIERAFLFGVQAEVTSGNAMLRFTDGFTSFATSNILNLLASPLTFPDLENWLEDVFQHTSSGDSRTLFCAPQVITAFDALGEDRLKLVPSDKTYGITVNQFQTSHGILNIVKHRLLEDGSGGAGYGSWGLAVDVKTLTVRPLTGGTTKLLTDRQSPGIDGWIDEYLTEQGLQMTNPEVNGILKNVGAAA